MFNVPPANIFDFYNVPTILFFISICIYYVCLASDPSSFCFRQELDFIQLCLVSLLFFVSVGVEILRNGKFS